jgi:hypothetical protein
MPWSESSAIFDTPRTTSTAAAGRYILSGRWRRDVLDVFLEGFGDFILALALALALASSPSLPEPLFGSRTNLRIQGIDTLQGLSLPFRR